MHYPAKQQIVVLCCFQSSFRSHILFSTPTCSLQHEYCMTVEDFIARRSRLAFLDVRSCEAAIPRVADIMAQAHGWSNQRKQ